MSSVGRGLLAGSLLSVVAAGAPRESRAEAPVEIVGLGGASAFGLGTSGSPAGWLALPALEAGGSWRPFVELDALDLEVGLVAPVVRIDWTTELVALSVDWSPDASVGAHARLAIRL